RGPATGTRTGHGRPGDPSVQGDHAQVPARGEQAARRRVRADTRQGDGWPPGRLQPGARPRRRTHHLRRVAREEGRVVNAAQRLAPLLTKLLGRNAAMHIEFWDGSSFGPADATARVVMRSPRALQRIIRAPGELGLGRAY